MYRLWTKAHFDAAHYIRDYRGKCSREHGHRWEVGVLIEGKELHEANMLIDFVLVKGLLDSLVVTVDHYQLNEQFGDEPNVTAEYLAKWFYDSFKSLIINQEGLELVRVCVWESPNCCIEYRGDD